MASEPKGYIRVPVWVDSGIVKPLVNDDGRVPVLLDLSSITLDVNLESSDITLPVEEQNIQSSIQSQLYGWDLIEWRKNPLIWGFTAKIGGIVSNTNADVGDNNLYSGVMGTGYIAVVTGAFAYNATTACTVVWIGGYITGAYTWFRNVISPAINQGVNLETPMILGGADRIACKFEGCVAGDDIYLHYTGYRMKVNE